MDDGEGTDRPAIDPEAVERAIELAFGAKGPKEGESVLGAIERLTGAASRILLPDEAEDDSPVLKVHGEESSDGAKDDSRYQIVGEIARGGVGIVFKSRDKDLGRDVALKVLRQELVDKPEIVQRFIEEAQIGGQLQHPGVVPVYGLGIQPDGRPYFAMKLVKGKTLAALFKARKDAGKDRRRLLSVFEKICQTIAYAHARKVIHRDLKPSNVIVGNYGQVQVVDWGFAKVMREGGLADEEPRPPSEPEVSIIETIRSSSPGSVSLAGSVMGTPAYMPPEQAQGQVAKIDARSDVFCLGAILVEILTGEPPYTGDVKEMILAAAECRTDDAFSRLDGCGADEDLVRLAKRCLAASRDVRPDDAGAVAEAVAFHLASLEERARKAALDAAAAEARAEEERKTRRRTTALAATVVLALLLGGVGFFFWKGANDARQENTARAVARALEEASVLLGRARSAEVEDLSLWPEVAGKAEGALELAATGEAAEETTARVREFLATVSAEETSARAAAEAAKQDRELAERLAEIRCMRGEDFDPADRAAGYAEAFGALDPAADRIRGSVYAEEIVGALDDWYLDTGDAVAARLLRELDPDETRWSIRDAARAGKAKPPADLSSLPTATLLLVAESLLRTGKADLAVKALRVAHRLRPEGFWTNFLLGHALTRCAPPRWSEAVALTSVATARRPGCLSAHYQLGVVQTEGGGDPVGAAEILRRVRSERPGLGKVEERLASALTATANSLLFGRNPGEHVRVRREIARLTPSELSAWRALGQACQMAGDQNGAQEAYRKALDLDPDNRQALLGLAGALASEGRFGEAVDHYRRLAETAEGIPYWQCVGWAGLASCLSWLDREEEALLACAQALVLRAESGVLMGWREQALIAMGDCLVRTGRRREAVEAYRALCATPAFASWDLVAAWGIVRALRLAGDPVGAQSELEGFISARLDRTLGGVGAWELLGEQLARCRPKDRAIRAIEEAAGGDPSARAHALTGLARGLITSRGDVEGGLSLLDRVLEDRGSEAPPSLQPIRCYAQWYCRRLGSAEEITVALIEGGNKTGAMLQTWARILREQGLLGDALAAISKLGGTEIYRELERLVALEPDLPAILGGQRKPKDPDERLLFARLCHYKGEHEAAAEQFLRFFAEDDRHWFCQARDPLTRYPWSPCQAARSAILAAGGDLPAAERARWRRQAVAWLGELALRYRTCADIEGPRKFRALLWRLLRLREDPDLAPIRDEAEIAKLPEEEQQACRKVWAAFHQLWWEIR